MNASKIYIVDRQILFSNDREGRLIMELPVGEDTKKVRVDASVALEMAKVLNKMYLTDN